MKQMILPLLVLAVFVVVIKILPLLLIRRTGEKKVHSYERKPSLMSPAERLFFASLEQAIGGHFRLFSKVRLADIVRVESGGDRSSWQSAFNAIQSKHVDFLAVDPASTEIKFAVELDDRSHQKQNRQDRDAFVDQVLTGAGIPIFRFAAKRGYSVDEIRGKLFE
ncbi:MAG: DUF2726 domain-containing protein [Verrucomicrobia bacterium]|nr:DUF2726 domain-containing protein [Kiritimatiellia bacterium]MCO6400652.1 DUF2726 domain-containing protein [Verrucomicrobiota bacterium]